MRTSSQSWVHAWVTGSDADVWCGSQDRLQGVKDISVVNEQVTCPECRKLLDEFWETGRPRVVR